MPIIHQILVELTSRHMSSGDCGKVGDGMVGDTVVEWKAWELPPRWLHHGWLIYLMALQGGCQVDLSELARERWLEEDVMSAIGVAPMPGTSSERTYITPSSMAIAI